jgi:hypothetical protein
MDSSEIFDDLEDNTRTNLITDTLCLLPTITSGIEIFFVHTVQTSSILLTWWKTTSWYQSNIEPNTSTIQANDILAQHFRSSPIWNQFTTGIHQTTGQPFVVCNLCSRALTHPKSGQKHQGTSSMRTHLQSRSCQQNNQHISTEDNNHQPTATIAQYV